MSSSSSSEDSDVHMETHERESPLTSQICPPESSAPGRSALVQTSNPSGSLGQPKPPTTPFTEMSIGQDQSKRMTGGADEKGQNLRKSRSMTPTSKTSPMSRSQSPATKRSPSRQSAKKRPSSKKRSHSEDKTMIREPEKLLDLKEDCKGCRRIDVIHKHGGVLMCEPCSQNLRRTDRMHIPHEINGDNCPCFECVVDRTLNDYMMARFNDEPTGLPINKPGQLIVIIDKELGPIKLWILKDVKEDRMKSEHENRWFFAVDGNKKHYTVEVFQHDQPAKPNTDVLMDAFKQIVLKQKEGENMEKLGDFVTDFNDVKFYSSVSKEDKSIAVAMPFRLWKSGAFFNYVQGPGVHPFGREQMLIKTPFDPELVLSEVFGQALEGRSVNNILAKLCHFYGRELYQFDFLFFKDWKIPRTFDGKVPAVILIKHTGKRSGHFMLAEVKKDPKQFIVYDSGHFVKNSVFFPDVRKFLKGKYSSYFPDEDKDFFVFSPEDIPKQDNGWSCGLHTIGNMIVLLNGQNPAQYWINIGVLWKYLKEIGETIEENPVFPFSKEDLFRKIAVKTKKEKADEPVKKDIKEYRSFD